MLESLSPATSITCRVECCWAQEPHSLGNKAVSTSVSFAGWQQGERTVAEVIVVLQRSHVTDALDGTSDVLGG